MTAGAVETPYAGLATRTLAFAVDAAVINATAVVVGAVIALCVSVLHLPSDIRHALVAIGGAAYVVWCVAYFVVFWSTAEQTPGDRVMRVRVLATRAGDGALKPRQALLRFVALVLAAIPLLAGIWMMLWDSRRRGLHDRMAHTVVVFEPRR
ncbi:MAG: hypothetical protein QOE86_1268 [Solirubrobacteraceae bacterium]|jgi:uncharacterized RDD family membrane protein YckC|nr:hypothetical protein [Solirubrobacteraceae bacterium]